MLNTSPVWQANHNATEDIIINQGGTDSGKTYAIVQLLLWYATTETAPKIDPVITVVGESIRNLKKGAYRAAESIINSCDFISKAVVHWNRTDRIITFKKGWIMEFSSEMDEQSAKQGKRQYLFFNEANGISWPIFWQMAKRTRKQVFIDYNPSAPFWAHEKLINTTPESNDLSATVRLIISDHRHNPFLSPDEHRKTEGIKDKELWRVYARGLTGNLTGLIFPTWKMIPDSDFPDTDFFGGLDFGYTNDPTAGVKIALIGESIFIHEMCYTPGISPKELKEIFKANRFTRDNHIYCEHDNDMISQLRRLELTALIARKGQGSVNAGILKLNEYKVFYTESSKNLHTEKTKYMWEIDKLTGKPTNTPQDNFNHLMDAVRYGVYTKFYRL